jgi:hypothetical protein
MGNAPMFRESQSQTYTYRNHHIGGFNLSVAGEIRTHNHICLKDAALHMAYCNGFKIGTVGFEPTTYALEERCSVQLSYAPIFCFARNIIS